MASLNIQNAVNMAQTLTVVGATTAAAITSSGLATFNGAVDCNSTANFDGAATFNAAVDCNNTANFDGAVTINAGMNANSGTITTLASTTGTIATLNSTTANLTNATITSLVLTSVNGVKVTSASVSVPKDASDLSLSALIAAYGSFEILIKSADSAACYYVCKADSSATAFCNKLCESVASGGKGYTVSWATGDASPIIKFQSAYSPSTGTISTDVVVITKN